MDDSGTPSSDPAEERRILLDHKLQLRRLFVDRLLIGVLLLFAGFISSILVEQYRAASTQKQFFLERRLTAANKVREGLSAITGSYFKLSVWPCELTPISPADVTALRTAIDELTRTLNSASILFGAEYLSTARQVLNIFKGIATSPAPPPCEARDFVSDTADYFTYMTRRELKALDEPAWDGFVPIKMSQQEINEIGAVEYFKRNLAQWQQMRKAQPPQKR